MMNWNESGQKKITEEFEELYKQHFESIYRFVFRMTGNKETSEELTQEAFVKLLNFKGDVNGLKNVRAWIYRTALHLAYDHLRRRKKYRRILEKKFNDERRITALSAEDVMMKNERMERFTHALDQLSIKDKSVLMLFRAELSYSEIARIMNVSKNTVGKKLFRARRKLLKLLEEKEGAVN